MSVENSNLAVRNRDSVSKDWTYRIGDLAKEFGVTLRTLRFYEDKGLITPKRQGTTRLYSVEDRERLELALFCKRIGLSLTEIRAILDIKAGEAEPGESNATIRRIYASQRRVLETRHAEIEAALAELNKQLDEMGGH